MTRISSKIPANGLVDGTVKDEIAAQVERARQSEPAQQRRELDPTTTTDARARHLAGGVSQASLLANVPKSAAEAGPADPCAHRNALAAGHVRDALENLGLPVGTDPTRIDDPVTQASLKRVQEAFGLPETGALDMETLMALVEATMAKDRRPRAPRPSSSGSSGSSGGGAGGASMGGTGGTGGAGGTGSAPGGNPGAGPIRGEPLRQAGSVDTSNWQPGAGDVTPQELQRIAPNLSAERAQEIAPHLNRAMAEAGINNPERKAAFIAQLAHESGGFKYMEEIASGAAYEGRGDLGNTQPGDGERFKGRGFIQVTGRANYTAASKALGEDFVNHPERAGTLENAARIAAWYWNSRGLNSLADNGNFDGITQRINGGFNGKADRDQYFARAMDVLRNNDGLPSTGNLA